MPKRKIYSVEEMLHMDREKLIEIHNREAERRNKQITRNRGRGVEAGFTGTRVSIIKKGTKMSNEDIIRRTQQMYTRAELNLSQMVSDISHLFGNDTPEFRQELREMLKEDPQKGYEIARKYSDKIEDAAAGKMESWRSIWYSAAKVAYAIGELPGFTGGEKNGTIFDYDELSLDVIDQIMDYLK